MQATTPSMWEGMVSLCAEKMTFIRQNLKHIHQIVAELLRGVFARVSLNQKQLEQTNSKTMIVGISGKKQHGKDTVAKMIAELSGIAFENKKFAGKLKQIVCLIIGCTMEQLEDPVFKETPLGDEWKVFYIAANGKSIDTHVFESEEKLYDFYGEGTEEDTAKSKIISVVEENLTPRKILQLLGTEGGRNIIHPNIWCTATMVDYKQSRYFVGEQEHAYQTEDIWPNWIITDVRFPNEAKAVKDAGGILIRVNRPNAKSGDSHPSETALDDYDGWDYVIENDGDLEQLKVKVTALLSKITV